MSQLQTLSDALRASNLFSNRVRAGWETVKTNPSEFSVELDQLVKSLSESKGILKVAEWFVSKAPEKKVVDKKDTRPAKRESRFTPEQYAQEKTALLDLAEEQAIDYMVDELSEMEFPENLRSVQVKFDFNKTFTTKQQLEHTWTFLALLHLRGPSIIPAVQKEIFERRGFLFVDSSTDPRKFFFRLHRDMSSIRRWNDNHPSVGEFSVPSSEVMEHLSVSV